MDEPRPWWMRSPSELAFSLRPLYLSQSVCGFRNHALVRIGRLRRSTITKRSLSRLVYPAAPAIRSAIAANEVPTDSGS